jgi:hypothetical protein
MAYLDPAAGKAREGRQTAAVTNVAAATAVATVGSAPTKAEHDALLADVAAMRTKLNALLAAMRTSGQLAP